MLKVDSERRELVRERRQARIERKQQRRGARERKRSHISEAPPAVSPIQRTGQEQVDVAVDRIV
jgi:transposase